MKQEHAIKHLEAMRLALQRYRSAATESCATQGREDVFRKVAAAINPWVFGSKNPLPAIVKTLEAVENGAPLEVGVYYNYMLVLNRFMPEIRLWIDTMMELPTPPETPDIGIFKTGWDDADQS